MAFYKVNGQLAFLEDGQTPPWAAGAFEKAADPNAAGVTDAYLKTDAYAKQKAADTASNAKDAATRVNANPNETPERMAAYNSYWAGSGSMTPSQVDSRLTGALAGNGDPVVNAAMAKQIDATKASGGAGTVNPAWNSVYQGIANQNPNAAAGQQALAGSGIINAAAGGGAGGNDPVVVTDPFPAGGGAGGGSGVVDAAGLPGAPAPDTVKPVMGTVTPQQTVQGQLGDILKTGNPLLEAAKARAMQTANARGLQNSSMAAQGGEEAMLAAALPIAQQDAGVWQKQALTNQDISNQFLSMEKGAAINLTAAYEAFKQNNYRFDKDEALKRYVNDTGNSTQLKVAAMQAAASQASLDQRLIEAGMEIESRKELQQMSQDYTTNQNLLQLKSNNFTNYTNGLNAILTSEREPDDKIRLVEIHNQQYGGMPMPDGWKPSLVSFPPKT